MIPLLLMLAVAKSTPPQTPIEAERAFAEDAKTIGQWTAFRKWSADEAVMFVPQPIDAREFLKNRKDPPKATDWWPTASYISCDGKLAVNTGGWKRPDGSVGYFSTVWQRRADGTWKWIVDGGDVLKVARARPAKVGVVRASCANQGPMLMSTTNTPGSKTGAGYSPDGSIVWRWEVAADGARRFSAWMATGKGVVSPVISDDIGASSQ